MWGGWLNTAGENRRPGTEGEEGEDERKERERGPGGKFQTKKKNADRKRTEAFTVDRVRPTSLCFRSNRFASSGITSMLSAGTLCLGPGNLPAISLDKTARYKFSPLIYVACYRRASPRPPSSTCTRVHTGFRGDKRRNFVFFQ